MTANRRAALLCLLILLPSLPSRACRYTVREIGYSDLAVRSYRLVLIMDREITSEERTEFEKLSFGLLLNSNIEAELVRPADADSCVRSFLAARQTVLPAAVLVSPEDDCLIIHPREGKGFRAIVWSLLEQAAESRLRDRLREELVRSFAVIFIFEEAAPASAAAEAAVNRFEDLRDYLPKPVRAKIPVISLDAEQFRRERVLLWGLGMDPDADMPQAAVIYGRGRRMGPVLAGDMVTGTAFLNLLSVVGADCECGLDHSWKLGQMMPLKWGYREQEALTRMLGFDVEHPRVKAEMSRILRFGPAMNLRKPVAADPLTENILESAAVDTVHAAIHVIEDQALLLTRITRKFAAGVIAVLLGTAALVYVIRKRKMRL